MLIRNDMTNKIILKLSIIASILIFLTFLPVKANEISSFQVEGLSIGESALKFFSKKKIQTGKMDYYNNKKYTTVRIIDESFNNYDLIEFSYLTNDSQYKFANIKGVKFKDFKMKNCLKQINEIFNDASLMFKTWSKSNIRKTIHNADPSNKSFQTWGGFFSKDGGNVTMGCDDYSDAFGSRDHMDVSIRNKDFSNFLKYAYK